MLIEIWSQNNFFELIIQFKKDWHQNFLMFSPQHFKHFNIFGEFLKINILIKSTFYNILATLLNILHI